MTEDGETKRARTLRAKAALARSYRAMIENPDAALAVADILLRCKIVSPTVFDADTNRTIANAALHDFGAYMLGQAQLKHENLWAIIEFAEQRLNNG